MRRLGIAALGLVSGVVVGLVLQEVLGVMAMDMAQGPGSIPLGWAIVIGLLIPVLAVAGIPVALAIDAAYGRRARERQGVSDVAGS